MTKGLFVFALIALIAFAGMAFSADVSRVMPVPEWQRPMTGEEIVPNAYYFPTSPGTIAQSPGDTAGYTQYDYQTNGSTGTRVVVDDQGQVHVAWMNGDPYPSIRHAYFNCKTSSGWIAPGIGNQVSFQTGAGYVQITTTLDDRSAIMYHRAPLGAESLYVALDAFSCLSSFEYRRPPNRQGGQGFIWPYGTTDRNGRIHVIATHNAATGASQPFMYTRSDNGGTTWVALQRVDTVEVISPMVTASRVSDKVAIVYTHATDTASQWMNDVYYIQSTNGTVWDFARGKINVTGYGQGGDSLFAYTDCDAVYDYNDNLHLLWNAQYVTDQGIYYNGSLFHWDSNSQTIHEIVKFDTTWLSAGCEFGAWNFVFAKMSIASDINNRLFVTYTSWDTSDCSGGGYANGDIYLNISWDGGATWSPKENMTNSHTPGCPPGDCDADHWSSLAEEVTGNTLHLFYVNDKDAGGIPQTEGSVTDNPMLYLAYPVTGIDDSGDVPRNFSLSQNYPNPFNARTNIGFELLENSRVNLAVYDVTGAKVATLFDGNLDAGPHQVSWDADKLSSGVYYYTMKTQNSELTKKMTLLK